MMRRRPLPPGNQRHQVLLRMIRVARLRPAQAVRHTKHVRVHRQRRLSKRIGHDHVRRLAAHARQLHQLFAGHVVRQTAPVSIHHLPCGSGQVAGLGAKEPTVFNTLLNLVLRQRRQTLGIRTVAKETRRNQVDAPVSALGGENRRHQKLPGRLEIERAAGIRVGQRQSLQDAAHPIPRRTAPLRGFRRHAAPVPRDPPPARGEMRLARCRPCQSQT